MQLIHLLISFAGIFTFAAGWNTVDDLPHPLLPAKFSSTGVDGTYNITLNGTAQEVYSQLQMIHPEINPEDPQSPGYARPFVAANITARAADSKSGYNCIPINGQSWVGTYPDKVDRGINYLNGLSTVSVGANACARISCSYDSAIYLCNDNNYQIQPNAWYMGTYAWDIKENCLNPGINPANPTCGGQNFDTDHYNIIVRLDFC